MSGWSLAELLDMESGELCQWIKAAVDYHNHLNRTES